MELLQELVSTIAVTTAAQHGETNKLKYLCKLESSNDAGLLSKIVVLCLPYKRI
jgi:hypothetical protein